MSSEAMGRMSWWVFWPGKQPFAQASQVRSAERVTGGAEMERGGEMVTRRMVSRW